jgi:hypothetical protein
MKPTTPRCWRSWRPTTRRSTPPAAMCTSRSLGRVLALQAGVALGDEHRLGEELLDLAGPVDRELVLLGELAGTGGVWRDRCVRVLRYSWSLVRGHLARITWGPGLDAALAGGAMGAPRRGRSRRGHGEVRNVSRAEYGEHCGLLGGPAASGLRSPSSSPVSSRGWSFPQGPDWQGVGWRVWTVSTGCEVL